MNCSEFKDPGKFEGTDKFKPCSEELEIYTEADVPPYEEEFTLSGGCCSGD